MCSVHYKKLSSPIIQMADSWKLGEFEAESRLFAPVAFQGVNECMRSLPADVAAQVLIESGTQDNRVKLVNRLLTEERVSQFGCSVDVLE